VDLHVVVGGAAGHAAAAVAAFDDASGAVGHDALRAADGERDTVAFPDRREVAVAEDLPGERLRDPLPVGRGRRSAGGVEVDPGAIPVTTFR
jgi:hypothetical protein